MSETMRERLARSIMNVPGWYGTFDHAQNVVCALLAKLREPTEGMCATGEHAWMQRNLDDPESEPIRDCFQAMIDHIREDKP